MRERDPAFIRAMGLEAAIPIWRTFLDQHAGFETYRIMEPVLDAQSP